MLDLGTLQERMSAAILTGEMSPIAREFVHSERLTIFHNNSYASLSAALKTTFAVTAALADERFFAYAAHEFIAHYPPREARLSTYGQLFPDFLARFPPSRTYPILAEMAAFEWAIASSLTDAQEPPVPMAQLKAKSQGGLHLSLQPNLRFAVSRWPVTKIWSRYRTTGAISMPQLTRQFSRIAIARSGEDLQFSSLDAAQFAFWRALAKGHTVELASLRALARDPLFDIVRQTLQLFRCGLVTGVAPVPHSLS